MMAYQPIAEAVRAWLPAIGAFFAKWGAGIAGAVVSLRFLPAGTTRGGRASAFGGGMAGVLYAAPAMIELLGVESQRVASLCVFVTGLLAMSAAGELVAAVHDIGLPGIVRGYLRRRAGLPEEQPPTDSQKGE